MNQQSQGSLPFQVTPKLVIGVVLTLLFFIFMLQNTGPVQVKFLFWSFELRRIILMLLSAAIGVGIRELAVYLWRRRTAVAAAMSGNDDAA